MTRLVVALAVIVGAVLLALIANRLRTRRKVGVTPPRITVPERVDRWDFIRPGALWLLAVFTSKDCSSCAEVVAAAQPLAAEEVAVAEVALQQNPELHSRYGVDAVPVALLVDADGAVRGYTAGPVNTEQLQRLLAEATDD